jgi:hypothetical protein
MSSSETVHGAASSAGCLAEAAAALVAAVEDPDRVADEALQHLLASAVRLYAVKAEAGLASPFAPHRSGVTADDVMILATDLLHALDLQLFELSMWQAMTGHCNKKSDRVDSAV